MYKSTAPEKPSSKASSLETWKQVQTKLVPVVKEALSKVSFSGYRDSQIKPKTIRELSTGKFLYVKSFEFEKPMIVVFYDRSWQEKISVEDGSPTDELNVYLLKPCKNYSEIYKSEELDEYGPYLVPLEDLELIYSGKSKIDSAAPTLFDMSPIADLSSEEEDKDENMAAMTIKDYLAIHQCMPVSNKPWLNDVIKKINAIRTKD